MAQQGVVRGGGFLIEPRESGTLFSAEQFSEEQKLMARACKDFYNTEVAPKIEQVESMQPGLLEELLEKAGKLGMLGVSVPETYGGSGMSFTTSLLTAEALGENGSFSTAFGAHTGIGTLPILYYGNDAQKEKYLPNLVLGKWKACYCLTEPGAGSDANAGKTRAVLNKEGTHYLLNGQKMWISNGGFADIFIVFAKIDEDKNLSAFVVEKPFGGITLNEEEKKMGLKGSSTRQVFFNDCPVPKENLLFEREQGFKIAVNILNAGRIKLASGVLGACKSVITYSVRHAQERQQFARPIAQFGAIQEKLANMFVRSYATESATYRASRDIEQAVQQHQDKGLSHPQAQLKGTEEFAVECAILKVYASETLAYVVDEGVQILGGMGFSEDTPIAKAYRDARVTRIYEGTNEINRMLLVGMLLKKGLKGQLPIQEAATAVGEEIKSMPTSVDIGAEPLASEIHTLAQLKKAILLVAGRAAQLMGDKISSEQEVLLFLAEAVLSVYVAESTVLRAQAYPVSSLTAPAAQLITAYGVARVQASAQEVLSYLPISADEKRVLSMGLKRFTKYDRPNTIGLRQEIAKTMIEKNEYPLQTY